MDKLLEVLGGYFGKTAGEISEALKDSNGELKEPGEIKTFLESQFQEKLKSAKRAGVDEGYGRAKKEVLSQVEKQLSDKYEVEQSGDVHDMIDAVIEKSKASIKMNPEDVKNSDVFQEAIKKEREKYKTLESELATEKAGRQQDLVNVKFDETVNGLISKYNFDLPEDESKRKFQLDLFRKAIRDGVKIDLAESGLVVLDDQGNPKQDESYNPVSFDDHVKTVGSMLFNVKQGNGPKGTGSKTTPPGGGGKHPAFETAEERTQYIAGLGSAEKMIEAREYYKTIDKT